MAVTLQPVAAAEKPALKVMFDAYHTAHADLVDPRRKKGDPTVYPFLDLYWSEPERRPCWIVDGDERVGFVLINAWSPSGRGTEHAIAEFYVAPWRRRQGLGLAAAKAALESAGGQWELQVHRANPAAMAFWTRAIAAVSPLDWEQIDLGDRVVHRFRRP